MGYNYKKIAKRRLTHKILSMETDVLKKLIEEIKGEVDAFDKNKVRITSSIMIVEHATKEQLRFYDKLYKKRVHNKK